MLRLKNIFKDHAIFQQDAELTVTGWADAGAQMELRLTDSDGRCSSVRAQADGTGRFDLPVRTPAGSWKPWTMIVSDGAESVKLEDVLFGEVWLACGQSNMEMPLSQMADRETVRPELKGVRFYQMNPLMVIPEQWGGDPATWGTPRTEDVEDAPGFWGSDREPERQDNASCIALVACAEMSRALGVPVGFINYNLGATTIETWLPYTRMDEFPEFAARLKDLGLWPHENCHNCSVLYHNVAPGMYGLKFRGAWWYQGESNVLYKDAKGFYRDALRMWHRVYSDLFGTEKGFPMLCMLLYPWLYGEETGGRGTLNSVFVELAAEQPEKFGAIPIYDLPPVWSMNLGNHPIHPAHKTDVGRRAGKAALSAAYGVDGLRSAAWMKGFRREADRIVMEYETFGRSLEARGDLDGFMVAGADGVWQHAQAEIVSPTELAVRNEAIAAPVNAMYQYLDTQTGGGLWCGEMPAAPAATCEIERAVIPMRPWTNLAKDGVWVVDRTIPAENGGWKILEAYCRPTWRAGDGSEICRDDVFSRTGCALRIAGDASPVSAWVQPYPTMALDLHRFSAMTLDLFCYQGVEARLELGVQVNECDVRTVRIPGSVRRVLDDNWAEVEFRICEIPGRIVKLKLVFDVDRPVKGVNIDHILLWPK